MKQRKLNLEQRFILIIIAIGTICFGLLGSLFYRQIRQAVIAQARQHAMGIAATAACQIDGELFVQIEQVGDDAYQKVYDVLDDFRDYSEISYIYTLKEADNQLVFVVDTDEENPAEVFEPYEYREDMKPAFSGQVCFDNTMTTDEWGHYYSAYAPVTTADGAVVGIVGCDVKMDNIRAIERPLILRVVLLITIFNLISGLIYINLSRTLMEHDVMTEISNYDYLIRYGNRLSRKKKLADYTGILINIKDFKYINQRVGAKVADKVLKEYAAVLKAGKERRDFLASTGGDNFFLLVKKGKEQAFLNKVKQVEVTVRIKDKPVRIPLSVRCGLYSIKKEDDIDFVLNACTFAVNGAKSKTNTDCLWFEDEMFHQMMQEKETVAAFKQGIMNHEFVVYYQPKVNIDTNTLCGAEALVRWVQNGKIVPPMQFIPTLEKNNLIQKLDFYVLEQVCTDIRDWLDRGIEMVRISTNFSKLHLCNLHFAQDLLKVLEKYQIDSQYIEAELTESSGYYDLEALTRFVHYMNRAHVSVSIDDFGTGYSSLSLLKDLNVDVVKVDKSFFRDIESGDEVNGKLVANVIKMVQDLGREVISEGIETQEQAEFLKQVKSPIVQGYLYDKPLSHDDFEKKLLSPHYDMNR